MFFKNKKTVVCVIVLDRDWCKMYSVTLDQHGQKKGEMEQFDAWMSPPYPLGDVGRLIEEIVRRIKVKGYFDTISISLPANIKEWRVLQSSHRLEIKDEFDVQSYLLKELGIKAYLMNDMDSMIMGLFDSVDDIDKMKGNTVCYMIADEGVGSSLMIDGKIHHGAGKAGRISRLRVEKNGIFLPELKAKGILEAYASRPWISRLCVEHYEALSDGYSEHRMYSNGQRILSTAAQNKQKSEITYSFMQKGLAEDDPIFRSAFKNAARYLGDAINAIITIVHPHKIYLSGGLITQIPDFYEHVIDSAKKHSWPIAWNDVQFVKRQNHRQDQLQGAALFALMMNQGKI